MVLAQNASQENFSAKVFFYNYKEDHIEKYFLFLALH